MILTEKVCLITFLHENCNYLLFFGYKDPMTSIRNVARRGSWRRAVQQPYQRPHLSQMRFLVKEETSKVHVLYLLSLF